MSGRLADVLDIAGTNALLAGCHPASWRDLRAGEIRLQRRHPCVDQQKAVVIVRHKRKTRQDQVSLALEELQVHPAQIIHAILFHNLLRPFHICHLSCSLLFGHTWQAPGWAIGCPALPVIPV